MALLLSDHVLQALQLTKDDSIERLQQRLGKLEEAFLEIVYSDNGCDELINIAKNGCGEDTVEIFSSIRTVESWCFQQIEIDKQVIGTVVQIPKTLQKPSTKVEKALVRAWNLSQELLNPEEQRLKKEHVILIWTNVVKQLPLDSNTAILTLLGVKEEIKPIKYQPPWLEKSTLSISQTSRLISQSTAYSNLLTLAAQEKSIRWRFLGFYRIFERGYLNAVLESINQSFFQAPKTTLENAEKTLSNEINQLVELAAKHNLSFFFETFALQLKNLKKNRNRYATMLERECDTDPRKKEFQGEFKKGVFLCYKIRCSIVHASGTSLIFDNFEDGEDALLAVIEPLEQAVLKYLGIIVV
jgi:hypothetical protein